MSQQSYQNHVRKAPGVFYLSALFALVVIILSMATLCCGSCNADGCSWTLHLSFMLLGIALIFVGFFARSFALKAQDRAIRAEENLRHFSLTSKLLPSQLSIPQIIALRFAPDEELVSLADKAVKENLTNKQIKQAIQNWRADEYRV